ncbi:MAG TPA: hypothetical protein VHL79_14915 [Ramlibacter sp.]|jgi:hypothetical protein|nr:hypothetical protein [Ramlibacter sp.]
MPHPKNRLKLTGDTHIPGPNLDLDMLDTAEGTDAVALMQDPEPRVFADGYVPEEPAMADASPQPDADADATPAEKVEDEVGKQAAKAPWLAIGGAIALGFMLVRLLRR